MNRFANIWSSADSGPRQPGLWGGPRPPIIWGGLGASVLFKSALCALAGASLAALRPPADDGRLALVLFGSALTLLAGLAAARVSRPWVWLCVYLAAASFGYYRFDAGARQIAESRLDLHGPVKQQWAHVIDDPLLKTSVDVEWMEGDHAGRRARLFTVREFPDFRYGEAVKISGWARGDKIYLSKVHDTAPATLTPFQQARVGVLAVRDRLMNQVREQAPLEYQGFVFSTLFGKRALLTGRSARLLEENGLSHILALSGLHTSILAGLLFWILRPFGTWVTVPATVLFLAAFVLAVGASPSVVRASLMTLMGLAGHTLGRRVRILPILAAAFLIEFSLFPQHVTSPGFQLSYLATLSLGFGQILFHYGAGSPAGLRVVMPLILIQVFMLPLSVHYFYRWSWISIIGNLLFLPVLSFLISLNALTIATGMLSAEIGRVLFAASHAVYQFTESVLSALPSIFGAHTNMGEVPIEWVWIFFALWTVYLLAVPKRASWWAAGAVLFMGVWVIAQDRRVAQGGDVVALTADRVEAAYASQGRRMDGLWLDGSIGADAELTPLVKQMLKRGIRDIDALRAPDTAVQRLAREFRLAAPAPDRRFRQYEHAWTWDLRPGLRLIHLTSKSPPGEISGDVARDTLRVLIYNADLDGRVVYPRSVAELDPNMIYVTGGIGLQARTRLIRTLAELSGAEILFGAVDGDVTLRFGDGGWSWRSELDEEMK